MAHGKHFVHKKVPPKNQQANETEFLYNAISQTSSLCHTSVSSHDCFSEHVHAGVYVPSTLPLDGPP